HRRDDRIRGELYHRRATGQRIRRPVPPRKVVRRRAGATGQLRSGVPRPHGPAGTGDGHARMILLPAIDILDGKAVRLTRAYFDLRTDYDADAVEAARRW